MPAPSAIELAALHHACELLLGQAARHAMSDDDPRQLLVGRDARLRVEWSDGHGRTVGLERSRVVGQVGVLRPGDR